MNKKVNYLLSPFLGRTNNIFLIGMRVSILLLCIGLTSVFAHTTNAQNIDIDLKDVPITTFFKEVQEKSDYVIIYKDEVIANTKNVSVKASNATPEAILTDVLGPLGLGYEIMERQIIINKKGPSIDDNGSNTIKTPLQMTVNGTVTDSEDVPLPGANIVEKGTTNGVTADFDGNFSLNVADENATLVVSYIGFSTKEVDVSNQSTINVSLEESAEGLDEVVVVGYGTQKKLNLTGAVSAVQSEDLQNRPITSASQALQGVQGVYINQVGGQPGNDAATIRVRGVGTLNNNNPLVLVNGIEFPINDLNPKDIESITVLKDAASAAIYGSRAANGVVLVTTKQGSENSQITYSNSIGVQEVISLPKVVKDPIRWFELYSQAQLNFGTSEDALVFPQSLIDEYRAGMKSDPFTYPNNDWYDIMFNLAIIQEHNLRFTGGSEKTSFALSLGVLDQNGVLRGTNSNRYNANFTINSEMNESISVGGTFNFSYKNRNEPVVGIAETMEMTFKAQSYHPTKLEDGNYGMNFFDIPGHRRFRNPLALAEEGDTDIKNLKLFLNTFAEVKLPFDIEYKLNVALTSENERQKIFTPQITLYDAKTKEPTEIQAGGNPYVTFAGQQRGVDQRDDESLNWTVFNTLKWNKSFADDTDLSILLGTSYENFGNSYFMAANEGYLGNDLYELNAGSTNPTVSGTSTVSSLISYFGRANYVWNEKYLFEANFRYDGSSRFAEGNKWGFFPSVSAGWRVNEEEFLKDIDWLGQLKIRGSWGQLGNERIGLFRYLDLVSPGQDYIFGNTINPGTAVLVDNDDEITWETTTISNVGIDATFLGSKLTTSLEYFQKTTKDVLRPVGIPSQVGALGGPIRNIGTIENNGIEVALGYRNSIGDFSYDVSGSMTKITNKVVDLDGEIILEDFSSDGRGPFNITQEGKPINQFLLYQSDGFFQSQEEIDTHAFQGSDTRPGYIRFKDLDNNGIIDLNDRKAEGNTIPKYTYSFNMNFSYKNWSLSTFWQGVEEVQTYNKHVSGVPFWFGTSLPTGWANDSWTPENRDASFPILTRYQDTQATLFRPSDFWLLDASYLRLKNIQLTYEFKPEILEKLGMAKLSIFCNAQNLITFTPLENFDPETDLIGNNFFDYPSTKIYTFGLNVSF
ncbi:TonB-dependent receptor [Pricia sp. S334]|uniref:TonB-dependent receptor n=1 Tax=Pricia mediterranea TaxID=3076079 RepID=A0ABU3L3N8_9FLAO|nr:TonB-dependent receptor [Pricia sp. S334]MDT7828366.1 TonB-dependent receptor [Pricia sp. S334]